MAKLPWKPWHEVIKLRDDLKSGELSLHMFAADLYEVTMQNGRLPIYERPEEFFALTFPTLNLRNLVKDVVLRLAGENDKAVRQLELTYGGGKTHTLITMFHLVNDPANLPDVPAVKEFIATIGQTPPPTRVAALCFDKLDVEKGMEVRSPDGSKRWLKQPWSVLAYQIAGDEGLRLLHSKGKAEERDTPPAENMLTELLSMPAKDGLGTLILIDEALLYAKVKVRSDSGWLDFLTSFFQYLTQAAAKVERCCIVASLLSSDPKDEADDLGRKIRSNLYVIFQRQREAAVQPVEKDDVAEVLRRRLFDPKSLKDQASWNQHVIAALKGINNLDEQTEKEGAAAEERYAKSYPFSPELIDVFYTKWSSGIDQFQKTRGVLRTFALAFRDAEAWDTSPLVGTGVFLGKPDSLGLSEAARELVNIADTIVTEGAGTKWTGILEGELKIARSVQTDSVGLHLREIEQAVMATFLHSQPTGRSARTREILMLVGPCRTDRIELEKGLNRWARTSHWLDDTNVPEADGKLPDDWRLGNKPNLNQMQSAAAAQMSDDIVKARLLDEILKTKQLTTGARDYGVSVHTLPKSPRDVEDDGRFHYAVLPPNAVSESGKPSAEAVRFLNENTGPEKPRVYRNALLLLATSKDGLEIAASRVRDFLAWEKVQIDLTAPTHDGQSVVDYARIQSLKIQVDKAKGRVPDAIRQAYCIVVTVSEKNEPIAFKISIAGDNHFETIKNDSRSRVQDTAITAEALLPGGPYSLWKGTETSRRVKDLTGAFAQYPHLPKMLKASAVLETLVEGCDRGAFALRLPRPDGSSRTWWRSRPDDAALKDPALELVLNEAAELTNLSADLLRPGVLPELWIGDQISVAALVEYFAGAKVVSVSMGTYSEPLTIPQAPADVVHQAVTEAVQSGMLWLTAGPASLLAEQIPAGVLSPSAVLREAPDPILAAAILPETLPAAWANGQTNALAIATVLSQQRGLNLPWKTVRDVIGGALTARFLKLAQGSAPWPTEFSGAGNVLLVVPDTAAQPDDGDVHKHVAPRNPNVLFSECELELSQLQDLAEMVPGLLAAKAKHGVPMKVAIRFEVGDEGHSPASEAVEAINVLLQELGEQAKLK